ncbi:hypothetical protein [Lewinella sp. W8]|uniref:hypothetical protein n=1 Tax=Lewinella sp. W8 TaxID=2528208 RepID=UPI0010675A91|nr:hypothetical protein [Lewinella sp. W8]MTB49539.1 hypothetical protein [Lewinella sp. W8]
MKHLLPLICICALLWTCDRGEPFTPEIPEGLGESDHVLIFGAVGGFGFRDFYRFADGKTSRDRYPTTPGSPTASALPFTQPEAIERRHWEVIPEVEAALIGRDLLADFPFEAFSELASAHYCGELAVDGVCSAVAVYDKKEGTYSWFSGNFADHPVLEDYMKKVWRAWGRVH